MGLWSFRRLQEGNPDSALQVYLCLFSTFSLGDYVLAVGPSSGNCSIYWGAQRQPNIRKYNHMSHSLNSLKEDFIGDYVRGLL